MMMISMAATGIVSQTVKIILWTQSFMHFHRYPLIGYIKMFKYRKCVCDSLVYQMIIVHVHIVDAQNLDGCNTNVWSYSNRSYISTSNKIHHYLMCHEYNHHHALLLYTSRCVEVKQYKNSYEWFLKYKRVFFTHSIDFAILIRYCQLPKTSASSYIIFCFIFLTKYFLIFLPFNMHSTRVLLKNSLQVTLRQVTLPKFATIIIEISIIVIYL